VFVKLGDDDDYTPVRVSGEAFVGDLKELVVAKLELGVPPNRVTLTKDEENTPLDSRLTVQEVLAGARSLSLIVKVLKVERVPGAWLARGSPCAQARARTANRALDVARSAAGRSTVRSDRRGRGVCGGLARHGQGRGAARDERDAARLDSHAA
jgi:hypothetical protein